MLSVSVKVQSEGHATRRTYFYLSIYLSHLSFICPICHLSIHPYIYLSSIIYLPIYPLIIYLSTHPSNQSILFYLIYLLDSLFTIYHLSIHHQLFISFIYHLSSIYLSVYQSIYIIYLCPHLPTCLSVYGFVPGLWPFRIMEGGYTWLLRLPPLPLTLEQDICRAGQVERKMDVKMEESENKSTSWDPWRQIRTVSSLDDVGVSWEKLVPTSQS
jgi:hypothetical protein